MLKFVGPLKLLPPECCSIFVCIWGARLRMQMRKKFGIEGERNCLQLCALLVVKSRHDTEPVVFPRH